MIVLAYLLLAAGCIYLLVKKVKRKRLIWLVVSAIIAVTCLFAAVLINENILVPSVQKKEFSDLKADASFSNLFSETRFNTAKERHFDKYTYKVRQGTLNFNKVTDETYGTSYYENMFYYRIYRFENDNDATAFIPQMLLQRTSDFYCNYQYMLKDTYEESDDSSAYPVKTPNWLVNEYDLGAGRTVYYLPSVMTLYDVDWFLVFGVPPGAGYDSACAIRQGKYVAVFFENSSSGESALSEAVASVLE